MKWNLPLICGAKPSGSGQAECALMSLLHALEAPRLLTQEFPRMKTALGVELWGVSTLVL